MTVWIMIFVFYATYRPATGLGDVQTLIVSDIASEADCKALIAAIDPNLRQSTPPACYSVQKAKP